MTREIFVVSAALLALLLGSPRAHGQLFENLKAFGNRLKVGDPEVASTWEGQKEGPKGIAAGDLDGDGVPDLAVSNLDGTVTVFLNRGDGKFSPPVHLRPGAPTLRDVLIADLTGDGRPDIACGALFTSEVVIFPGTGGGGFEEPLRVTTWEYSRDLAAGDFDGDGAQELVAAGPGKGVVHYRRGPGGSFAAAAEVARLAAPGGYTKPAYTLEVVRRPGAQRDELLATYDGSPEICVLAAGAGGALEVRSCVPVGFPINDIEAGPILSPAAGGRPDMVLASRDTGFLEVLAGDGAGGFTPQPAQQLAIPGGPRSLAIADLDGDGWNDVAVVLRNLDRVLTLRNESGQLRLKSEMPVGTSPREVASADFNGDGQPDLAVINRFSEDVSILSGYPGQAGFGALDQFYLVDGEVSGLVVRDLNGDQRDDVLLLHRAAGDFSVRLAGPEGQLGSPRFYPMGSLPADMTTTDINRDGRPDVVVVSLGTGGIAGRVSVRFGDSSGGFGPEMSFGFPPDVAGGGLFAVEVADFDQDGVSDLAVGFFDCRLGFYRGNGDGSLTFVRAFNFVSEARAMAGGDFDGDGDMDLAGAGYTGELVVVENRGDLLTTQELPRRSYPPSSPSKFGATSLVADDLNRDGDLDLVMGSRDGAMVYLGSNGTEFVLATETLPGTGGVPASSGATGDLDGDGRPEIVVSCHILSCVVVLTPAADGNYVPVLAVDVPGGNFVAVGDLDGDGKKDLVGAGKSVLWTALSGRRAEPAGPPVLEDRRERIPGVVINEVLAINNALAVEQAGGSRSDWIELYNGSAAPASLAGWRLTLVARDQEARQYAFPAGTKIEPGAHLLLIAGGSPAVPGRLGFRVPGGGGTLTLEGSDGKQVDRLEYPEQRDNISFARYRDGLASFVFNLFPSPEAPNTDNGPIEPLASVLAVVPAGLGPQDPLRAAHPFEDLRFYVQARDDVGIVNLSVLWRRVGAGPLDAGSGGRVVLFDDGMNGDGGMLDGLFSGVLFEGLPPGGALRFHLEVVDLSDNLVTVPEDASFAPEAAGRNLYTLALPRSKEGLEISEFVARNQSGLRDEAGQTADWVEVRNCSTAAIDLGGWFLGDRYPADEEWFAFPAGTTLAPGAHLVVFCDGNTAQGPLHTPFRLGADGGRLVLVKRDAEGAAALMDAVDYPAQQDDEAWGRKECGGSWTSLVPTPGATNPGAGAQVERGDVDGSQAVDISDPIGILNHLFNGAALTCPLAADVNVDARLDVSDPIALLGFLFLGEPSLPRGKVDCR